jgi:hypothetical protein
VRFLGNIRRRLTDTIYMHPDPDPDPAPDDTERFAFQACPHCSAVAAVLLCLATAVCAYCDQRFEVAPLEEPNPSSTLRNAAVAATGDGA